MTKQKLLTGKIEKNKKIEVVSASLLICDRCKEGFLTHLNSNKSILSLGCDLCRQGVHLELKTGKIVQRFVIK